MAEPLFRADPKQPSEIYPIAVDWENRLSPGETIVTHGASAIRLDTGADATSDLLILPTSIVGTQQRVTLKNGSHGVYYKVTFTITTSAGHLLEADVILPVVER
jgi:hypothetical protein